jgi:hypothetical protein
LVLADIIYTTGFLTFLVRLNGDLYDIVTLVYVCNKFIFSVSGGTAEATIT